MKRVVLNLFGGLLFNERDAEAVRDRLNDQEQNARGHFTGVQHYQVVTLCHQNTVVGYTVTKIGDGIATEMAPPAEDEVPPEKAAALERLLTIARKIPKDDMELIQYDLDDAVHQSMGDPASDINNSGYEAQIRHLLLTNALNEESIRDILENEE